jgi:hypothetical protein
VLKAFTNETDSLSRKLNDSNTFAGCLGLEHQRHWNFVYKHRRTKRWTRSRGSGGFEMVTSLAAARSTRSLCDEADE